MSGMVGPVSEGVKHESKVVLFHGLRARGLSHEVLRKARYGLQRGEWKKKKKTLDEITLFTHPKVRSAYTGISHLCY